MAFLVFMLKILSFLPLFILGGITKLLYLLNNYIFRYRNTIIIENLQIAFPNKNDWERKKIQKAFYLNFFQLIGEIIKLISIKKSCLNKKVKIQNQEIIQHFVDKGRSVILLSGHYNNWEWMGAKISCSFNVPFVAVYKTISSSRFNQLMLSVRQRFGGKVVNMEESMRYFVQTTGQTQIIGMIADQNPIVQEGTPWLSFFGKVVPVFLGAEKIAKKYNYPVVFCNMEKKQNHHYIITFEVLAENPIETAELEITKKYFNRLEEQIRHSPANYLWSHRRWKHAK